MNRRSFIQAMLLACAAPAVIKIDNLMKIAVVKPTTIIYGRTGFQVGDILEISTVAMQRLMEGVERQYLQQFVVTSIGDGGIIEVSPRILNTRTTQWHRVGV